MPELDRFLQPITDDNPSGEDLRLVAGDLTFSELDEMRREADPLIDPGGETKHADWRGVADLCESALTEKTKDLEIAAVYTQALVHREGLAGLEKGLHLLSGLVSNFWDNVHPGYDDGEIILAIRARPLSWIGTSKDFLSSVGKIPLSDPIGDSARSWFDYEQAQRVDTAGTKSDQAEYQELIDSGYITTEQWRSSLNATPPERLTATMDLLRLSLAALRDFTTLCDEKFADDAPYFMELSNLLDDMLVFLEQFVGSGVAPVDSDQTEFQDGSQSAGSVSAQPAVAAPAGPIASRDEAYRRLREVAEYLRKIEPHSPVPPLIDRAVRWGNMTFENLFEDVVKNQDVRNQTKDLLGLEEPPA